MEPLVALRGLLKEGIVKIITRSEVILILRYFAAVQESRAVITCNRRDAMGSAQ